MVKSPDLPAVRRLEDAPVTGADRQAEANADAISATVEMASLRAGATRAPGRSEVDANARWTALVRADADRRTTGAANSWRIPTCSMSSSPGLDAVSACWPR